MAIEQAALGLPRVQSMAIFLLKFDRDTLKLNRHLHLHPGEVPFATIPCRTCNTARLSAHSL
jgi:hypothetical protein